MGIAAGVAAAGVAGVAGAAISSSAAGSAAKTQANAATQAANTQAQAADQASDDTLQEYNQTQQTLSPYTGAGNTALNSLQAALGLTNIVGDPVTENGLSGLTFDNGAQFNPVGGSVFTPVGGSTFQPTQAQLAATPGYQFDLAQGLQSTQNSNAAQGLGVSGAALKGAASYATGLANNTLSTQDQIFNSNLSNQQGVFQNNYNNQLNAYTTNAQQFQTNLGNVLNPLTSMVNLGENAGATVGQQGIQAVQNSGNQLIGGANASAAGTIGSANASAAGTIGQANAASSALSSAGNSGLNYALYNNLLGNSGSSTPGSGGVGGSNALTESTDDGFS